MMKSINLRKAMSTLKTLNLAENHLKYIQKEVRQNSRFYSEADEAAQQAVVQAAKEAFTAATAKIDEAIRKAEGRSTARTITSRELLEHLSCMQSWLQGIPMTAMEGVSVSVDLNAQDFPRAYKYTPESTWFDAGYNKGSWHLYDLYRYRTAASKHGTNIDLPEATKKAVLAKIQTF